MAVTKKEIIETIDDMPTLDLRRLVEGMGKRFGVPVTMPTPAKTGASQEMQEEATEFDVVLTSVGLKKIVIIKEVRAIAELDLRSSKALVDDVEEGGEAVIKSMVSKAVAEAYQKQIEQWGATVKLRPS